MRKLYVLMVVLVGALLCSSAFAAEHMKNRLTVTQRVERLTAMLELSPEQQVKAKDILTRRDKEMEPLFASLKNAYDKEEQREIKLEILEQHQKFRNEFNGMLTSTQRMKYEEAISHRIKKRKMRQKK